MYVMQPAVLTNGKYSSRQGSRVDQVVIHHWGAMGTSLAGTIRTLSLPTSQGGRGSANYIVARPLAGSHAARVFPQVPYDKRAWTSGSFAADKHSVTFELEPGGDPDVLEAVAELIALHVKRGELASTFTVVGHRDVMKGTACPGEWYPLLGAIRHRARVLAGLDTEAGAPPAKTPPAPAPAKTTTPTKGEDMTVQELLNAVLGDVYSDGRRVTVAEALIAAARYSHADLSVDNQQSGVLTKLAEQHADLARKLEQQQQVLDAILARLGGQS